MTEKLRLLQLMRVLVLTAMLGACTGPAKVISGGTAGSISPVGRFGIDTDLLFCPADQIKVCDRFGVALRDCECRS